MDRPVVRDHMTSSPRCLPEGFRPRRYRISAVIPTTQEQADVAAIRTVCEDSWAGIGTSPRSPEGNAAHPGLGARRYRAYDSIEPGMGRSVDAGDRTAPVQPSIAQDTWMKFRPGPTPDVYTSPVEELDDPRREGDWLTLASRHHAISHRCCGLMGSPGIVDEKIEPTASPSTGQIVHCRGRFQTGD